MQDNILANSRALSLFLQTGRKDGLIMVRVPEQATQTPDTCRNFFAPLTIFPFQHNRAYPTTPGTLVHNERIQLPNLVVTEISTILEPRPVKLSKSPSRLELRLSAMTNTWHRNVFVSAYSTGVLYQYLRHPLVFLLVIQSS